MTNSPKNESAGGSVSSDYALGSTEAEHEGRGIGRAIARLTRQAALLAPCTERFFREAGITPGQRVLDIGSGAGDVAVLIARLVGPSGEVLGVERDPRAVARARARIPLGSDPGFTRWIYDLLCSLRPQVQEHGEPLESLGDFNTLRHRLQAEVTAARTVVPFVGLVGAWSRRPAV